MDISQDQLNNYDMNTVQKKFQGKNRNFIFVDAEFEPPQVRVLFPRFTCPEGGRPFCSPPPNFALLAHATGLTLFAAVS